MSNRYRQPKKSVYTGSPWAIDPVGFNPFMVNPVAAAMLNMQTALGAYGAPAGPIFNRNFDFKRDFGGAGNYGNQLHRNSYYGGSSFRPTGKRGGGRGNYSGGRTGSGRSASDSRVSRNKRGAEESAGNREKKFKASEPYNPEEPTREEDDDDLEDEDDTRVNSDSEEEEKSSKFGANAPSQDWKKDRDSHYCTVCELDFSGSFLIHRRTKEHRKQRDKKFPRCRFCRKTFQGVKEFEEHGKSEDHRKKCENQQALKEQRLVQASLSDSEDEETALKRYIANQGVEKISDEGVQPVGEFHVVPLKTFFCKLCQKFFSNYTDGREVHCQTPDHIHKYKEHNSGKEARAIERNNLRQAEKKEKSEDKLKLQKNSMEEEQTMKKNGEEEQEIEERNPNLDAEKENDCEDNPEEKANDEQKDTGAEADVLEEGDGVSCEEDNEGLEEYMECGGGDSEETSQ